MSPALSVTHLTADFENLELKMHQALSSSAYTQLVDLLSTERDVYVVGNGGLHYVASHMATDLSRLLGHLSVFSFDSVGFITSNANDHGYENIYTRWFETIGVSSRGNNPLIIGLSCSGSSTNIINAFNFAAKNNIDSFLISGKVNRDIFVPQLCFECQHYHTVEALSLMLFYHLVHSLGFECPKI